ncbi:MAG: SDR family oxidoreductase [Saprospiraceae bacterium]|nr:SDR family oxidoreductase [Saprospiraceae bacterium]
MKKKILLTGASGFLGYYLMQHPQTRYHLVGTYFRNKPRFTDVELVQINLIEMKKVKALVEQQQADLILHCAAIANVNFCEQHPAQSYHINVQLSKVLADLANQEDIPLIYTSTDLVFDGEYAPYQEQRTAEPISRYGRQKLEAEEYILTKNTQNWVCRLPLLFGSGADYHRNFLKVWKKTLEQQKNIYAFTDEYRNPISAIEVAQLLFQLIDLIFAGVRIDGDNILHLAGNERISRYDFAKLMAKVYKLDAKYIIPSKRKDVPMPRAKDTSLVVDKAKRIFKWNLPSLEEQLTLF